ncbi:hypothetical protein [Avibacterium sp. 21-599]|uniref:hypothetical protein n=1 Tax=Avibacterium sp. 21-599 TaxID=2911528 RepID=UPI0022485DE8|nr:hypothetical protein [Avibacterium sp. 21-599]MCW9717512.1 hypothetical protein [Avibacterium sp. 21-599]
MRLMVRDIYSGRELESAVGFKGVFPRSFFIVSSKYLFGNYYLVNILATGSEQVIL